MSDCQRTTKYVRSDGSKYELICHDEICLVNERNEYWARNNKKKRSYSTLLKRYRNKGINSIDNWDYAVFARECFLIVWDLILRDMINYNYAFKFPYISGGYIVIVGHQKNLVDKYRYGKGKAVVLWVDFQKYITKRFYYKFTLSRKLKNKIKDKVNDGHNYETIILNGTTK